MTDSQGSSNQWNTPWRASGFAVYDTSGNLVAHTGITGNRSMQGKQLELMAAMIAEAVNAYSAGEPPVSEKLPPLPKVDGYDRRVEGHYSATSMLEYGAMCAINERRKRAAQPPAVDQDDDALAREIIENLRDAQRYRRLQILGVAPAGSTELKLGLVMRFTNLDNFVDTDIKAHPSRGEYSTVTKFASPE